MSDKPVRSFAQIQEEYQKLCYRAGHIQYQVYTYQRDLDSLNSTLRDLNIEAAAAKNAEAEQPKESS